MNSLARDSREKGTVAIPLSFFISISVLMLNVRCLSIWSQDLVASKGGPLKEESRQIHKDSTYFHLFIALLETKPQLHNKPPRQTMWHVAGTDRS